MSRVPGGRRVIAGLLASSLLMALAVMPGSPFRTPLVSADDTPSDCSSEQGGSEAPDFLTCYLEVFVPPCSGECEFEVPAGTEFTTHVLVKAQNSTQVTTGCAATVPITLTLREDPRRSQRCCRTSQSRGRRQAGTQRSRSPSRIRVVTASRPMSTRTTCQNTFDGPYFSTIL